MICTKCDGTGFLNYDLLPLTEEASCATVLAMIHTGDAPDVAICDCCGDGTGWYGVPGHHYEGDGKAQ